MASKMDEDGVVAATAFRGEEEATTWECDEGCIVMSCSVAVLMDRDRFYLVALSNYCAIDGWAVNESGSLMIGVRITSQ